MHKQIAIYRCQTPRIDMQITAETRSNGLIPLKIPPSNTTRSALHKVVDKTRNMEHGTWNIPEHLGTSNNYDNYEKNMMQEFSHSEDFNCIL